MQVRIKLITVSIVEARKNLFTVSESLDKVIDTLDIESLDKIIYR